MPPYSLSLIHIYKKVWQALESKGFQIMSGLDVIEYTLKAGEKDRIIDCLLYTS